jgi:hypothetical protein
LFSLVQPENEFHFGQYADGRVHQDFLIQLLRGLGIEVTITDSSGFDGGTEGTMQTLNGLNEEKVLVSHRQ